MACNTSNSFSCRSLRLSSMLTWLSQRIRLIWRPPSLRIASRYEGTTRVYILHRLACFLYQTNVVSTAWKRPGSSHFLTLHAVTKTMIDIQIFLYILDVILRTQPPCSFYITTERAWNYFALFVCLSFYKDTTKLR